VARSGTAVRVLAAVGGVALLAAALAASKLAGTPPLDRQRLAEERSKLRSIAREGAFVATLAGRGRLTATFTAEQARDLAREALSFFEEMESTELPAGSEGEVRELASAAEALALQLRRLERSAASPPAAADLARPFAELAGRLSRGGR
jgi:hypothetical protein